MEITDPALVKGLVSWLGVVLFSGGVVTLGVKLGSWSGRQWVVARPPRQSLRPVKEKASLLARTEPDFEM
ncbi:MAG: hypothetical protein HQL56_02815 [Magnetococcales bacterium]|nr:hypothetical protein [Magnetococcales bacterium]